MFHFSQALPSSVFLVQNDVIPFGMTHQGAELQLNIC